VTERRDGRPEFRATYRLQLTPDFGFAQARALVPYLRDLGGSHLYLSPSLQAREGSQHGYDVVDPRHISDALGGEEEFRRLAAAGLRVILDIVPNHMAAVDENPFWRDLELRQMFFDVDLRTGFHRRFFDVGDLGGLRQEDWEVFWATHAKVIELVREGVVGRASGLQRHVGLRLGELVLVLRPDDRGLEHRGVTHERGLDLGGRDPLAGDLEHVVAPALVRVVAVRIEVVFVTGDVPLALERGLRFLVLVPVEGGGGIT